MKPLMRVVILSLVALVLYQESGHVSAELSRNYTVPAVFVFGDSIVDPGNNNGNIKTIVKCNFPPYGKDFPGRRVTGRFSNGRVPSDFIAEIFKVKKVMPGYLEPSLQFQDLLTGVSFASGGGGFDPLTAKLASVLSLTDQLEMFREYKKRVGAVVGEKRLAQIVSESVHIVCSGANDIANTYFLGPFRRTHYSVDGYTDLIAGSASSFLQELYKEGARRIGVVSLPPVGCVPAERTLSGDLFRRCSQPQNDASAMFNTKLSSRIDALNKKLPQARVVYLDIFNPLMSLIRDPSRFGFEVVNRGCCGTGNIEVSVLCNSFTTSTCGDVSKYVFWDSFHPSERGYQILTHLALDSKVHQFF